MSQAIKSNELKNLLKIISIFLCFQLYSEQLVQNMHLIFLIKVI